MYRHANRQIAYLMEVKRDGQQRKTYSTLGKSGKRAPHGSFMLCPHRFVLSPLV
jgi:hypothetical protein